jgi:hypothetical protein
MPCIHPAGIAWAGVLSILAIALVAQAAGPPLQPPQGEKATDGSEPRPPAVLPQQPLSRLPVTEIQVDMKADLGALEAWRQAIGHGGVNSTP